MTTLLILTWSLIMVAVLIAYRRHRTREHNRHVQSRLDQLQLRLFRHAIKAGDYVRLHSGEVVEVTYAGPDAIWYFTQGQLLMKPKEYIFRNTMSDDTKV